MKFLIHANGPFAPTGYGVQCGHLATMLAADGHEVAISSTYGHPAGYSWWTTPLGHKIKVFPQGYYTNSDDIISAHADVWFEGNPEAGWLVIITDVWAMRNPEIGKWQTVAWAPVDHFPVPRDVLGFFHKTNAVPLAMSRFGRAEMIRAGLDPGYVPLAVDLTVYKPTPIVEINGRTVDARTLYKLPHDAFVVGMVAMNKGWARDRKGFNEAFRAFGAFWQSHQNAVLFVHSEQLGAAEGINLVELATHCGIPHHALVWTDQYAYRIGLPPNMMAAAYTAMDVLLAPSHGEGFCVPLIEAQACGTPVIATDFSAQPELVGAGWLVTGQPEWDPAQHASYVCPFVHDIFAKLEEAYAADLSAMSTTAQTFAANYDVRAVYETYWRPFLATLAPGEPEATKPTLERVDVIVPAMRAGNVERLALSLAEHRDDRVSALWVTDAPAEELRDLIERYLRPGDSVLSIPAPNGPTTYAEKCNAALTHSAADWVLIVGDDVEFTAGWLDAAVPLTDRYDVIGTNDSEPGRVRNPDVAAGRHADHFFVRRAYVDNVGASLDGPGVLMSDAYRHWYVDKELVGLAKARGVFTPCLESIIVHHHPGFDGDETARATDPSYARAVDASAVDRATFLGRVGLIEAQRPARSMR